MLVGILTFIGWAFVLIPVTVLIVISYQMIKGAAGDDGLIMSLVMLGFTIFIIGVVILLLLYVTDLFSVVQ